MWVPWLWDEWQWVSLSLTTPSGILGDLPDISRLTKYRGSVWWTSYFPLRKLEFKESSARGDSSKDSTEDSSQGEPRCLEAAQGATGQDPVCWRGILRDSWRAAEGSFSLCGISIRGLLSGDPKGYGEEGPGNGYHRELWGIFVMWPRTRGVSLHGSSVVGIWRGGGSFYTGPEGYERNVLRMHRGSVGQTLVSPSTGDFEIWLKGALEVVSLSVGDLWREPEGRAPLLGALKDM